MEQLKLFRTLYKFPSKRVRTSYFENLIATDVVRYKKETIENMNEGLDIKKSYFKLFLHITFWCLIMTFFNIAIHNVLLYVIFSSSSILFGITTVLLYRFFINRYNKVQWTIEQLSDIDFLSDIQKEQLLIFEERKKNSNIKTSKHIS